MRVYYDRDADVNLIKAKKVAVIGYGSQGNAHANNLRDSGCKDVVVALRPGSTSVQKAEAAGIKVLKPAEAAKWADVVMVLTPDELQAKLYAEVVMRVEEACRGGRQCYWVCALIEESEELECQAAEEMAASLSAALPNVRVGLIHGRLPGAEKDALMQRFAANELQLLVATTVIEVGVDVPNATVMVIDDAERMGLAQLHQLRGRIGRGAAKSYCVLMTGGKVSEDGERRLDAMVRTSDGFQIAELDLELRGPGEFFGTRQAGMPSFQVANLIRDRQLLEAAKREAAAVLAGPNTEITQSEIDAALRHMRTRWHKSYGLVEVG